MRPCFLRYLQLCCAAICVGVGLSATADQFQIVTGLPSGQSPPVSAAGDSVAPVMSRDGRYILFASTADNLMVATNGATIPSYRIPALNVFLRERTNGTTSLVSVNLSGTAGGNADSLPVDISSDARYVLFESGASDLVPGDTNNAPDVFVRDLATGTTTLVSVGRNGLAANRESHGSVMTPDARYVAFVSSATNLVNGDTNGIPDVFVRDLQTGTTVLVSVGAIALPGSIAGSEAPDISADGRFVAFYSAATNVVPNTGAVRDIYVRDLLSQITLWASAGARDAFQAAAGITNVVCCNHRLSDDGHYVVYEVSSAIPSTTNGPGLILRYNLQNASSQLVYSNAALTISSPEDARSLDITPDGRFIAFTANATGIPSTNTCILVWDGESGAIVPVSVDLSGQPATSGICDWPAIDLNGRYVCFLSTATNLVTDELSQGFHLFIRDLASSSNVLVDAGANLLRGALNPDSLPRLADDGQLVAFKCFDSRLIPNDQNGADDVFLGMPSFRTVNLISAHASSLPSATPNGPSVLTSTAVSRDGRFVAFANNGTDLQPKNTNAWWNIYVKDLSSVGLVLASTATNGLPGDGSSFAPSISPDGRFIVFGSLADNLVAGDNNGVQDIFIRDLELGVTRLVSLNYSNTASGNGRSFGALVSSDGRYVLFVSRATDLAGGNYVGNNLFLRDMLTQTNYALGRGVSVYTMTPDARFVAFAQDSGSLVVWSLDSLSAIFSDPVRVSSVALSADGRRVAYGGSWLLRTADPVTGFTNSFGLSGYTYADLRLSADGRLLVVSRSPSPKGISQVYLFYVDSGSSKLLSSRFDGTSPADGASDLPDISVDNRFVAFRSSATDILTTPLNGLANIFLYDLQQERLDLLSSALSGSLPNNASRLPIFSGDGRTLFFQSTASNLLPGDFNRQADIFAYPFLYASITRAQNAADGAEISWPCLSGKTYQVEYQNSSIDAAWHVLPADYVISGNRAVIHDPAPDANQRIYRITASDQLRFNP